MSRASTCPSSWTRLSSPPQDDSQKGTAQVTSASRTSTEVTHYHIQKKRRAAFVEEWRGYQKTVMALADVEMVETDRGTRGGVYCGEAGDRPTRPMGALAHENDQGVPSTIHRHSWDAMVFVVAGWG